MSTSYVQIILVGCSEDWRSETRDFRERKDKRQTGPQILMWPWHAKRMGKKRLARKLYKVDVEARRDRGRHPLRMSDGFKNTYNAWSLDLRDLMLKCMVIEKWKDVAISVRGRSSVHCFLEPTFDAKQWMKVNCRGGKCRYRSPCGHQLVVA